MGPHGGRAGLYPSRGIAALSYHLPSDPRLAPQDGTIGRRREAVLTVTEARLGREVFPPRTPPLFSAGLGFLLVWQSPRGGCQTQGNRGGPREDTSSLALP